MSQDLHSRIGAMLNATPPNFDDSENSDMDIPDMSFNTKSKRTKKKDKETEILTYLMENKTKKEVQKPFTPGKGQKTANSKFVKAKQKHDESISQIQSLKSLSELHRSVSVPSQSKTRGKRSTDLITVDSDDENVSREPVSKCRKNTLTLEDSFGTENREINIKINWKWMNKIDRYPMRMHQKFETILPVISEKENIPIKDIHLSLNDIYIRNDDTPDSIGYTIAKFIVGRIIHDFKPSVAQASQSQNTIQVKVQSDKWKKPIFFDVEKTLPFKILYIKISEELKCSPYSLLLKFDGEPLIHTDTPASCDFDGGEVVDLQFK